MTSISPGSIPSRRMFSAIPSGETPVSNRIVRSRPPCVTRTSAEKPGSATSASGTPVSGLTRAGAAGTAPWNIRGQFTRDTPAWSTSSASVRLSIRIVIRIRSTGSSSIEATDEFSRAPGSYAMQTTLQGGPQ